MFPRALVTVVPITDQIDKGQGRQRSNTARKFRQFRHMYRTLEVCMGVGNPMGMEWE